MNWLLLLYNFWVISTATASLAALLPSLYLFNVFRKTTDARERRLLLYFAIFCFSVAYEAGNAALSTGLLPGNRASSGWVIALRMSGRLLETVAAIVLSLRLSGLINGRRKSASNAQE